MCVCMCVLASVRVESVPHSNGCSECHVDICSFSGQRHDHLALCSMLISIRTLMFLMSRGHPQHHAVQANQQRRNQYQSPGVPY